MAVFVHSVRQVAFLNTQTLKMLAGALVQAYYAAKFWFSRSTKRIKNIASK